MEKIFCFQKELFLTPWFSRFKKRKTRTYERRMIIYSSKHPGTRRRSSHNNSKMRIVLYSDTDMRWLMESADVWSMGNLSNRESFTLQRRCLHCFTVIGKKIKNEIEWIAITVCATFGALQTDPWWHFYFEWVYKDSWGRFLTRGLTQTVL